MQLTPLSSRTFSTLLALLAVSTPACTITTGDSHDGPDASDDRDRDKDDDKDDDKDRDQDKDAATTPDAATDADAADDAGDDDSGDDDVDAQAPPSDGADSGSAGTDSGSPAESGDGGADASVDDEPPVITLNGAPTLVIDCDEDFEDPGAEAMDAQDGDLDVDTSGGPVDSSEPGSVELVYSATDSAGNTESVTRTVSICGPNCGDLGKEPVDLRPFTPIQYEQNSQADANWEVSEDGSEVTQTVNADASIFLSDFDTTDLSIEGSWQATGSSDNDLMGFVFGYQDPGHFYLFDWKGGTQTYGGMLAEVGMSLKIVAFDELPEADGKYVHEDSDDFWATAGTENVTPLTESGEPFRNEIPWEHNTEYRFFFEAHQGNFRIAVYDPDGELLEDWSVSDSTYPGGRFGLYNFSQGPVEYSAFLARQTPIECSTVDAPPAGDAGATSVDAGSDSSGDAATQ